MRVLKFGGSSLATPARIRDVGRILLDKQRREPVIVVVSAFQGVTNQLVECARLAERGDSTYERLLQDIARRHRSAARRSGRRGRRVVRAGVEELLAELRDTLHGIYLLRHCPLQALDMTASFGERLSALIIAALTLASRDLRRLAAVRDHRRSVHAGDRAFRQNEPGHPRVFRPAVRPGRAAGRSRS